MKNVEKELASRVSEAIMAALSQEVEEEVETESPIEHAMVWAFILAGLEERVEVRIGPLTVGRAGPLVLTLRPQYELGHYRIDFLVTFEDIETGGVARLAVECDGHDYHERTKEQGARDRARDRYLQSQDIPIFRFTGTEIWHDAVACAREAVADLERRTQKGPA
jgi:very-short-patch-repair endonuclease